MTSHSQATTVHRPYTWEYADETEREAATGFAAEDVGRLARQLDDNSLWMLTDDSPETWVQLGGESGGRQLIDTASPTGVGTVTFSSIPSTYNKLVIEYAVRGTQAATEVSMDIAANNDTTNGNYRRQSITGYGGTTVGAGGGDDNVIDDAVIANSGPANEFSFGRIEILFYASTAFFKQIQGITSKRRDTSSVHNQVNVISLDWENTNAINRLDFILSAGNFASGSIFNLYGDV